MFSIINTGLVRVLVWYSPGSRAISSLAPRSARPVTDPRDIPEPSLILPWPSPEAGQPTSPTAPGSSHTPAFSSVNESSHTQEFARGLRDRHRRRS
jgi:hypothetical protein